MKKKLVITILLVVAGCVGTTLKAQQVIHTPAPPRPSGQTDVLELRTAPIPVVRVAFIGLGMRGPEHVKEMTYIPGVKIVALCDVLQKNTQKENAFLKERGLPQAKEFYGDTAVWRKVVEMPGIDLVYIATNWQFHAKIALEAMKHGKNVAIEVPSALNMKQIWDLVNMSEKTRLHCIQMENCVYDDFELTTLNMAQHGLFGDILHGEGAYIHGLQPFWLHYWNNWRMDYNSKHRGDLYPTHGLGPIAMAMNIHRGDKLNYLVSMDTKAWGNPHFVKETTGKDIPDFQNGDMTTTMIRTEKGKTILLEHDVTNPRPYNRLYQLTGTKGFANKYPVEGLALSTIDMKSVMDVSNMPEVDNLNAHNGFVPKAVYDELMKKYQHPIVKEIAEKAKEIGGHGGMDFVEDYRLIYCLHNGLPLDMDVYDLAEWCSVVPLSEISIKHNSAPVEIPDFTRGNWNKLKGVKFYMKK